ncbi:mitochondrial inner membrane protein, putative [Theileria annulata]|uniref:Mitochondrial inner membrane protein, putative n=1 Tax=Theileria annulata TaxID=5874 RepID=Q4UHS3_THEAN|nr:mitochondrial inner membrane protein, putative [Theileria annulata]CAI73366.1 mitochondrial inner membrane protein, putative [Theileria annulata]|eukprot:XP_954043.1 mitochondrial inner membrane protein, putative [Theileria annulata]
MGDYLNVGSINPNLEILEKKKSQSKSDILGGNLSSRQLYLTGYGRHWGEKLTYSVGLAYGSGILCGGSFGLLKGISKGGATTKLFVNSILNNCSTYGPKLGNRLGCLTIIYCGINSLVKTIRGSDESDKYSAPIAGLLSGAVYKISGPLKATAKYSLGTGLVFTAIDYALRNSFI